MKILHVSGYEVKVDDDFVLPEGCRLSVMITKSRTGKSKGPRVMFDSKDATFSRSFPRYLMGLTKNKGPMTAETLVVDHLNHDTLDNRKENLRVCMNWENASRRKDNTSGHTSIVWNKVNKRWSGQLWVNGKVYRILHSKDKETAAQRMVELRKNHGRYLP